MRYVLCSTRSHVHVGWEPGEEWRATSPWYQLCVLEHALEETLIIVSQTEKQTNPSGSDRVVEPLSGVCILRGVSLAAPRAQAGGRGSGPLDPSPEGGSRQWLRFPHAAPPPFSPSSSSTSLPPCLWLALQSSKLRPLSPIMTPAHCVHTGKGTAAGDCRLHQPLDPSPGACVCVCVCVSVCVCVCVWYNGKCNPQCSFC